MAKKSKPHYKIPLLGSMLPHLAGIPPYQRPGAIVPPKPYTPAKPYVAPPPAKPKPKRADYLQKYNRKPIVQYTAKAWDAMHWLVDACPIELGWVGAVEQVNRWHYIIHDLRVMEQEATSATFEYDDWNDAVTEMIVKKSLCPGRVDANLGHSHVNMGVNPSGTDEEQMMELAHFDDNEQPTVKFAIQTIVNKSGSHHCAIYDWEHNVHYDKVEHEVLSSLTSEDIEDLEMQLKRVKKRTYASTAYTGAPHATYYGGRNHNAQAAFGFADGNLESAVVDVYDEPESSISRDKINYWEEDPLDPIDNPLAKQWTRSDFNLYDKGYTIDEVNVKVLERINKSATKGKIK